MYYWLILILCCVFCSFYLFIFCHLLDFLIYISTNYAVIALSIPLLKGLSFYSQKIFITGKGNGTATESKGQALEIIEDGVCGLLFQQPQGYPGHLLSVGLGTLQYQQTQDLSQCKMVTQLHDRP